jgi:hypothetical protein
MISSQRSAEPNLNFLTSTWAYAIACAYDAVTLDYHGDKTLDMSAFVLWGIGETTVLLMVFCIPAIPKAVGGKDVVVSRLGQHCDHGVRMATDFASSHKSSLGNQAWRREASALPYRESDEGSDARGIGFRDIKQCQPAKDLEGNGDILRTTEFATSEN